MAEAAAAVMAAAAVEAAITGVMAEDMVVDMEVVTRLLLQYQRQNRNSSNRNSLFSSRKRHIGAI